jgi:hypothetical protein
VAFGIGFTIWQLRANKPRVAERRDAAPVQAVSLTPAPARAQVTPSSRKHRDDKVAPAGSIAREEEAAREKPEIGSSAAYSSNGANDLYRVPGTAPIQTVATQTAASEPQLGRVDTPPAEEKKYITAEDGNYVGKVVNCEKPDLMYKWNDGNYRRYSTTCFDVGENLIRVYGYENTKVAGSSSKPFLSRLEKNDVAKVRLNDNEIISIELVKDIRQ